jgi:hypothetical protein
MRRIALVPLRLLAVLVVGCGGGGGSSSSAAAGSEAAWKAEVASVMGHFGEDVEALQGEFNSLPPQQSAAEGMYMGLAQKVSVLTRELEATEAPAACAALKGKIVGPMHEFVAFARELGDQPTMTTSEYASLAHEKIGDIAGTVQQLGETSAAPHC